MGRLCLYQHSHGADHRDDAFGISISTQDGYGRARRHPPGESPAARRGEGTSSFRQPILPSVTPIVLDRHLKGFAG